MHILGGVVVCEKAKDGILQREVEQLMVLARYGRVHFTVVANPPDPAPFRVAQCDAVAAGANAKVPLGGISLAVLCSGCTYRNIFVLIVDAVIAVPFVAHGPPVRHLESVHGISKVFHLRLVLSVPDTDDGYCLAAD